ncbi:MAG TPA: hypothetical protein VGL15_00450 [Vicinamibacteria bacterium]
MSRVAFLGWLLFAGLAGADEVFIRGGGRLTGEIVERGPDSILVDLGYGQVGLSLVSVERIVASPSPLSLYEQRAARLGPDDVTGWLALGQWAGDHDLPGKARTAFEYVLSIDPDDEAAHRALGDVRIGDQWMTLEESYRARGYVRFEGAWVSPQERRAMLDDRLAAAQEDLLRAEADARVREAEARARAAEAEARRAEAELRRAEAEAEGPVFPGFIAGFSPWFAAGHQPRFYGRCRGLTHAFVPGLSPFFPRFVQPFVAPLTVRNAPIGAPRVQRPIARPAPHRSTSSR